MTKTGKSGLICLVLIFIVFTQTAKTAGDPAAMVFGGTVDSASYRYPGHPYGSIDEDGSKKEIDLIWEIGMDFFRIDIRQETLNFPDEVKKLDNLVAYGRSKKLKVYLGVYGREEWMVDPFILLFTTYPKGGGGKASWEEFKNMYTGQTSYLLGRYKPDYLMIMAEARQLIGNQVNSVRSVSDWVDYTKKLAATVKKDYPGTTIVLDEIIRSQDSISSVDYVEGIMKDNDPNIDKIAIDPYDFNEFDDELSTSLQLVKQNKWHGELWVGETNIFNSQGDDYQKKYFDMAIDQARQSGFTGFVVFYLRDLTVIGGNRGIVRENFEKKPACLVVGEKIKEQVDASNVQIINSSSTASNIASITWRTISPATSLVKYGTESGIYDKEAADSALKTDHSLTLTGLRPNTTYYFLIQSAKSSGYFSWSNEFNFITAQSPPPAGIDKNIHVYPNPYSKNKNAGKKIIFSNLPREATIRIYTLSGQQLKTLDHKDGQDSGLEEWDVGNISSGVYLYTIVLPGKIEKGKIAIIK